MNAELHKIGCQRLKDASLICNCGEGKTLYPPTEMTSLREIKDKLDALLGEVHQTVGIVSDQVAKLDEKIGFMLESQGKLLARLDAIDAGLHETAMRNHQQLRAEFDGLHQDQMHHAKYTGEDWATLRTAIDELGVRIAKPPRKARKKARR